MRIYLCRHGQTTGDVEDRYGGDYDDPLTEIGTSQSAQLANKLKDKNIEVVYSSPLLRARETAGIIGSAIGVSVKEVKELRERNWYGVLTGMTKSEAKKYRPDQVALLNDYHRTLEGGEAYNSFGERVTKGLKHITDSDHKVVAAVIHGGVFKNIFREILKLDEVKRIEDCGYAVLDIIKEKFNVVSLQGVGLHSSRSDV